MFLRARGLGARIFSALVVALTAAACGGSAATAPTSTLVAGRVYLNEIVDLMQANSVNRLRIDWTSFRAQVLAAAGAGEKVADTYGAISLALGLLDDHHSFYTKAGNAGGIGNPRFPAGCGVAAVASPSLPSDIGYVRVPSFGGTQIGGQLLAESLQRDIRDRDADALKGWIVDLRGNGGGNMWPMLAGIGPILGDGIAGYFVYPTDQRTWWGFNGRASVSNGFPVVSTEGLALKRGNPRVAVLTDKAVASSGEAIVVAFRGRPETRSFGTPTCGVPTSNQGYILTDSAILGLTTAIDADRTGTTYDSPIPPDEVITDPAAVVQRAIEWLRAGG